MPILVEVELAETPVGKRARRDPGAKRGGSSVRPRKAELIPLHSKADIKICGLSCFPTFTQTEL